MTLEAVTGKNAVTHVGKLYNLAARAISEALISEPGEISAARCALVSQIGQPVHTPQIVDIEVTTADEGLDPGLRARHPRDHRNLAPGDQYPVAEGH